MAVDPTGKFIYENNFGSNNASAYAINATSGALTGVKGSPFKTGFNSYGVAVDPAGKFAYVACSGSDNVYGFAIDGASGVLRPLPGSPFAEGYTPEGLMIAPTARFAFLPNQGDSGRPQYFRLYHRLDQRHVDAR